jgi:hypothetical protein
MDIPFARLKKGTNLLPVVDLFSKMFEENIHLFTFGLAETFGYPGCLFVGLLESVSSSPLISLASSLEM